MKHKPQKYLKRRDSGYWAKLPLIALVEIFQILPDTDRVSCAQVCRQWYVAYESPILWRKRAFEFGGSRFRPLGQAAITYAKRFGRHLRETKISCHQLTSHTCQSMIGNLDGFLQQLVSEGPPSLTDIEINGLELEFWRYIELRDEVAECLVKFYRTQKALKTFRMPNAQFPLNAGVDVLQAMASGNSRNVKILLIDHFFQSRIPVFQSKNFNSVVESFTNLHSIELNYCCLSDSLVSAWADTLRGKLKKLWIHCCDNEPHNQVIKSSTWSQLTNTCPDLQVVVSMFGIGLSNEVIPILAYTMPLSQLTFFAGYDSGVELGLSTILAHITSSFYKHLSNLELEFDNYHDRIDEQMVALVSRCSLLHHLKIKARMDIDVARFICTLVHEGRSRLASIDITLCDISPIQAEQLANLREEVDNVILEAGVELMLRDDLYT